MTHWRMRIFYPPLPPQGHVSWWTVPPDHPERRRLEDFEKRARAYMQATLDARRPKSLWARFLAAVGAKHYGFDAWEHAAIEVARDHGARI